MTLWRGGEGEWEGKGRGMEGKEVGREENEGKGKKGKWEEGVSSKGCHPR